MKLVSMKNAQDVDYATVYTPPVYSGGLCLYLDREQCEALGITSAPKPGTQFTISAKAIATSVSASVDADGDSPSGIEVSLNLQITDLGLQANGVTRNAAKVLYGGTE